MVTVLLRALPADRVLVDDVIGSHLHVQAEWGRFGTPAAVVRPTDTAEVQTVVRPCREHRTPVVARGAGTGPSGGASAVERCVVVSTASTRVITGINVAGRYAVERYAVGQGPPR